MARLLGDILDWSALDADGRRAALARPRRRTETAVTDGVRAILDDVRTRGGAAVTDWSLKLDGAAPRRIAITPALEAEARAALPPAATRALKIAAENVRIFHQATRPDDGDWVETRPGVRSRIAWRPLESAGLYVPGGTAPLFSSLLMLAIPAQVAGVGRRVAVTPPSRDGQPHPAMIVAAAEAGLEDLWLIGGAQAIAALTFGATFDDGEIEPVAKLFGPGNAWVAEAKKQASALPGGPSVDMPAGPSELLVIADRDADAVVAAADLLSQAEHDPDAQVLLVSDSRGLIEAVQQELELQLETLPRADIARAALAEGRVIRVKDVAQACEVSNLYGPEHLAIQTLDAEQWAERITAAGAVFVGPNAAETLGDYAAGPSHVLPTDGGARTMGGVTTASFMTSMSIQSVSAAGAAALAPVAAQLARMEGLEAHARAADLRSGQ
ncbi:histidinol dehydrogenase [Brevundimonas sp. FT23042]|uniref:histidinol dehydrogenase n=1 Tax=Brevundimonas sp. FT23042 TaxID=3393749 RepID=UPI003B587735